jgi:2-oxoglutarate ferredoxin oxidoreductase subunit alpha
MTDTILISGNEAIARGAIQAGCKHFFGYPITPQSEILEFMSRELPKIGGSFVQTESETASVYMVHGGGLAGARVMTSTASPGFSLMQEGISYISELGVPCVIVDVARIGPGIGVGGQQGQTDYRTVTKGGGHGAYRCIVLAPAYAQECFDFMQLGFHLADKYRILTLVLSDYIVGQTAEPVEIRTIEFEVLPEKDWALKGKDKKGGKRNAHIAGSGRFGGIVNYHIKTNEKYQQIIRDEIRYETYKTEDASLLLVAYGSSARSCKGAIDMARSEGLLVGLLRPITLWPFPNQALYDTALKIGKVLVVEDSPGELIEDVEKSTRYQVPVHLLGIWGRHSGAANGIIHPERILEEVKKLL